MPVPLYGGHTKMLIYIAHFKYEKSKTHLNKILLTNFISFTRLIYTDRHGKIDIDLYADQEKYT